MLAPTTTDEREVWMRRRNKAWAERLQDLSGRYANSTGIRPRHFEVWFPAGDIVLRDN